MILLNTKIEQQIFDFFQTNKSEFRSLIHANTFIESKCGIKQFFNTEEEIGQLKNKLSSSKIDVTTKDRAEYGDFQTNNDLTEKIVSSLKNRDINPQVIIEPTCGKGNFIIAALNGFNNIEKIFGIEIYEPYIWQSKFSILLFFIQNPEKKKPEIQIIQHNIFDFDFSDIKKQVSDKNLLILGNPPWVTSAKLSIYDSKNTPLKNNYKHQKGLDAITGKGNFDIAEYITVKLIHTFGDYNGHLAFLVKNSVIKSILFEQKKAKLPISNIEKQNIDSRKEFNVAVEASLLFFRFNRDYDITCEEFNFYTAKKKNKFGWKNGKFLSNIVNDKISSIDGRCPFEWRQGIKHDCSKVMELEQTDETHFYNKLGESIELEKDLIYSVLKSSDLKQTIAPKARKYTIITQKTVGQSTDYIKNYPLTYNYLQTHSDYFNSRKSSIYKGKPNFSIFGIGNYSFKPYKIAISGLYKTFHFTLIEPQDGKPVMLDDTCYFIGFDTKQDAEIIWNLLNSDVTKKFLESITFTDEKRMITKDNLMRIDLEKIGEINSLKAKYSQQLELF